VLVTTRSRPADALSLAASFPRSACVDSASLTIVATRRHPVSSQRGDVSRQILLRHTPGAHRATRNSCRRIVNRATVLPLPTRFHATRQSGNTSRLASRCSRCTRFRAGTGRRDASCSDFTRTLRMPCLRVTRHYW